MTIKTQVLQVRLTEEENENFRKLAEGIGENRSTLMRKMIRESINGEFDLLSDEEFLLKLTIRQLLGISNNLNQVTKAMHSGLAHRTVDFLYLDEIKKYITDVIEKLETIILKSKHRWVKSNA